MSSINSVLDNQFNFNTSAIKQQIQNNDKLNIPVWLIIIICFCLLVIFSGYFLFYYLIESYSVLIRYFTDLQIKNNKKYLLFFVSLFLSLFLLVFITTKYLNVDYTLSQKIIDILKINIDGANTLLKTTKNQNAILKDQYSNLISQVNQYNRIIPNLCSMFGCDQSHLNVYLFNAFQNYFDFAVGDISTVNDMNNIFNTCINNVPNFTSQINQYKSLLSKYIVDANDTYMFFLPSIIQIVNYLGYQVSNYDNVENFLINNDTFINIK